MNKTKTNSSSNHNLPLPASVITRYSRQLLLPPPFGGIPSLKTLLSSHIVVIGCGGLASPLLLYLAGAGVGKITIIDGDFVEVSNLHRQVIHSTPTTPILKVDSAKQAIYSLNPTTSVITVPEILTHDNAVTLLEACWPDAVVDCTDNVKTRYCISDALQILSKKHDKNKIPLISAAAMGTEGQLTVYNYSHASPCYRCIYPSPSPSDACKSCSDSGVLGPIVGVMGTLQAVEVIKVLLKSSDVLSGKLLVYDGLMYSFYTFDLPFSGCCRDGCVSCSGGEGAIETMEDSKKLCEFLKGPAAAATATMTDTVKASSVDEVTCSEYFDILESKKPHVLIDVRPALQFEMCSLENAFNFPLDQVIFRSREIEQLLDYKSKSNDGEIDVFVMCRRGIASVKGAEVLRAMISSAKVFNVKGGLTSWSAEVDSTFPAY